MHGPGQGVGHRLEEGGDLTRVAARFRAQDSQRIVPVEGACCKSSVAPDRQFGRGDWTSAGGGPGLRAAEVT